LLAIASLYRYTIAGLEQWKLYQNEEFKEKFNNLSAVGNTNQKTSVNNILTTQLTNQIKKIVSDEIKNSSDKNEQSDNVVALRTRKP
jgi:hypothetical protein